MGPRWQAWHWQAHLNASHLAGASGQGRAERSQNSGTARVESIDHDVPSRPEGDQETVLANEQVKKVYLGEDFKL